MMDKKTSGAANKMAASKSAVAKSPRPMAAGPAREVRKNQMMLDRSARLGDAGPKVKSTASKMAVAKSLRPKAMPKMGYKDGGMCAPKKGKK